MLTFLKPLMRPPRMFPKVKGAVALLSHFQRLSLSANANHLFPLLQIFSACSFICRVTCIWRMSQKSCLLMILFALFYFLEGGDIREKSQPEKVLKGRILNHFWFHIFLLSLLKLWQQNSRFPHILELIKITIPKVKTIHA